MIKSTKSQTVLSQKEKEELAFERARARLIDFEIVTNPKYDPNWHHNLIASELEKLEQHGDKEFKILILTVPPRHGKSQQASIDFPAWYLGRNPDKEIITSSYSGDLAQDFGSKTREKVESEEFQLIFPGVRLKADEKAKGKWRVEMEVDGRWKSGGSYTSVGVGGSITGRGANILLVDDPIKNREEAESQVYRDKIWNWFTSTAFTRLEPGGVCVIIVTRWHQDDLVGRILEHPELKKRTKLISFPAIAIQKEPNRAVGEPLWPTRYNEKALDEIRTTVGPYDWSALFQGTPILSELQEFKPEWYKYINEEDLQYMNLRKFLTIDTAMTKKETGDYTGFCENFVNQENFWHLRAWRMRLGPEEFVDTLFTLYSLNKYEKIGIEKTTYTIGLKPYLDAEQRKRKVFLPIVELGHKQIAKEIRIRSLIPRYASGSVFHVKGRCKDLEEEQASFPMGTHDDVLDAAAYQDRMEINPPKKKKASSGLVKRGVGMRAT